MIRPTGEQSESQRALPTPQIKKSRWAFPLLRIGLLIWIVPLFAAALTCYYGYTHLQEKGQEIVINFTDGSGLKAGETTISHLGVQIGKVTSIELSPDKKQVRITAALRRSQEAFARQGAVYWTVRPQVSLESISGLSTVLSGPYIEATPGTGPTATEFDGLQKAPTDYGPIVNFVLHAPRLERLSTDAPVYYRGIQVGMITAIDLSPDASGVDVHLFVKQRYGVLVQTDSKFWIEKGADIKGGLLSGLQLKLGSLQEIVSGGVTFATPENGGGAIARDGAAFPLYDEPKKEWLDWSPRIAIPTDAPKD